jgi:hypothetical protein
VFTILQGASDKLLGGAMLLTAAVVFTYYTTWAMLLVRCPFIFAGLLYEFISPSLTRRARSTTSFLPGSGQFVSRLSFFWLG